MPGSLNTVLPLPPGVPICTWVIYNWSLGNLGTGRADRSAGPATIKMRTSSWNKSLNRNSRAIRNSFLITSQAHSGGLAGNICILNAFRVIGLQFYIMFKFMTIFSGISGEGTFEGCDHHNQGCSCDFCSSGQPLSEAAKTRNIHNFGLDLPFLNKWLYN